MREGVNQDLQTQKIRLQKTKEVASKATRGGAPSSSSSSTGAGKKGRNGGGDSIEALLAIAEAREAEAKAAEKRQKAKEKKDRKEREAAAAGAGATTAAAANAADTDLASATSAITLSAVVTSAAAEAPLLDPKDVLLLLARDKERMADGDSIANRRSALQDMHDTLFVKTRMEDWGYSDVFQELCKAIFKRYADPVEKVRELAWRLTRECFQRASDLTMSIGYFMPAVMARLPAGMAFDEEMKVFVFDLDEHEAYRRGVATPRADKNNLGTHTVLEPSEEIRLLTCQTLATLIQRLCSIGAASVLHPYFHESVMFLQAQLRDPYPELKMAACEVLTQMTRHEEFTLGMKFFSVALCRAVLPVMRHRHAKVRVAAVQALTCVMSVKDVAKQKGAGTDAIIDLVGFREENVLSVAAFYTSDVTINYLAEVVQDPVVQVRFAVAQMLTVLLTEILDRYDHQTRLLPYVLDLCCDPSPVVSEVAMACITKCGVQFEGEHADSIIERRQYGVDGDLRINLTKALPAPFTGRPRIGMRMYVRGNCKRFLNALVAELTNWVGTTRLKSANLLKLIVIFMEEHLTMEMHTLLPAFIKALSFATDDGDKELRSILLETYELVGRYVLPEVYVHYIIPRLNGDAKVVQFGVDTATRVTVLEFLGALLDGSQPKEIAPLFELLVSALTDPFVISQESSKCMNASMAVMHVLLGGMVGRGKAAVEAHFLNTGRLGNLRGAVSRAFTWLFSSLHRADLCEQASQCLVSLALLDRDSDSDGGNAAVARVSNIKSMFLVHGAALLKQQLAQLDCTASEWHSQENVAVQQTLQELAVAPWGVLFASLELYKQFLDTCVEAVCGLRGNYEGPHRGEVLCYISDLVTSVLTALLGPHVLPSSASAHTFGGLYGSVGGVKAGAGAVWPAVSDLFPASHVAALVEVTRQKLSAVLEVLVLHDRWGKSYNLQLRRLKLLASLLGNNTSSAGVAQQEEGAEEDSGSGLTTLLHAGMCVFSRAEDAAADTPGTAGVNIQKLLQVALALPSIAKTPLDVRLLGVAVAHQLLVLLHHSWDVCGAGGGSASRVRPYAYWTTSAGDAALQFQRTCSQLAARESVGCFVGLLDDTSDAVRYKVCAALQAAVPLVLEEESAGAGAGGTFLRTAHRLLHELIRVLTGVDSSAGVSDISVALGEVLRLLAVLQPSQLQALLARTIPTRAPTPASASELSSESMSPPALPPLPVLALSDAQKAFKEPLTAAQEALFGLQDHCALLMQLQK